MDAFAKKYLHNAVKHAESTLSGNYKSGNNFAKKIEKMNSIILELEDQVTADNIINDIIDSNCANAIMWIAPVCAHKHYKMEIIKNMLLAYSGDNKLGILALNVAMLLRTL